MNAVLTRPMCPPIHATGFNDTVSGQRMPCWACASSQAELGLRYAHICRSPLFLLLVAQKTDAVCDTPVNSSNRAEFPWLLILYTKFFLGIEFPERRTRDLYPIRLLYFTAQQMSFASMICYFDCYFSRAEFKSFLILQHSLAGIMCRRPMCYRELSLQWKVNPFMPRAP